MRPSSRIDPPTEPARRGRSDESSRLLRMRARFSSENGFAGCFLFMMMAAIIGLGLLLVTCEALSQG